MGVKTGDSRIYSQNLNLYAKLVRDASVGLAVKEWTPLRSWPAAEHRRDADMEAYRAYPSQYQKKLDK